MITLTKEWLQQKIADMEAARDEIPFGLDEDDSNTLAALRIALASHEAEPVAYIIQDSDARSRGEKGILRYFANISDEDINEYEITVTPLYTAPPAPVSAPRVPNSVTAETCSLDELGHDWNDAEYYAQGWNACRDAMLQGADPVQAWIPCSERMPDTMISVLVTGDWFRHAVSFWDGASWCDLDFEPPVTHWQPLPAAPQQEA
ncbi:DUF551 domain-containing protein [Enterobacter roggenkampii]|uniref:DUF551 domain-containing protein n=1 Tax=Enterobacter roggenkampii TaxID=1812935 RepID=UPI002A813EB2|nr:DUF551 domain-containing protein [Enterobacter roggenkampii]